MNTGIYTIEHLGTGRRYVGSAVNFANRWRSHLHLLRNGRHHSVHLQRAWDKYGEANFVFKKLIVCAKEHLTFYEQRAMDAHNAVACGFNIRPKAESMLGFKHSQESIEKSRAANTGRKVAPELIARMTGRKLPAEVCAKMSASRKGKKKTPEWVAKIALANRGRVVSEETKEKLRKANLGKKSDENTRSKQSASHMRNSNPERWIAHLESRGKLTFAKADAIRMMYHGGWGLTQAVLGKTFGVDGSVISDIIRNKKWVRC